MSGLSFRHTSLQLFHSSILALWTLLTTCLALWALLFTCLALWALLFITVALAAVAAAAVSFTFMAGYAILNPLEQILILVELSIFHGMRSKACCCCTIRRRVLVGLSDLSFHHSNCDVGFGDAMLVVVFGLSLAIAASLSFGAVLVLRLNLGLVGALKLVLAAAMASLVTFESLASHLRNLLAKRAMLAFWLADFNGCGGFLTLSRSHCNSLCC